MKVMLLTVSAVILGMFMSSCNLGSGDSEPQIRMYADAGLSRYFTLGTITSSGFIPFMAWQYAGDNAYSGYTDISAGTYYIIYDTDSNHGDANVITNSTVTVEDNKKYTAYFFSGSYIFAEDK